MSKILNNLKKYNLEAKELVKELFSYSQFENRIKKDLKILKNQYLKGEFGYEKYKRLKQKINETNKKQDIKAYSSYILDLLDKIEYLNSQIFLILYDEKLGKKLIRSKKSRLPIFKKIEEDIESYKIDKLAAKIDELDKNEEIIEQQDLKEENEKIENVTVYDEEIIKETEEHHNYFSNLIKKIKLFTNKLLRKEKIIKEPIKKKFHKKSKIINEKSQDIKKDSTKSEKTEDEPLLLTPQTSSFSDDTLSDNDEKEEKTALDKLKEEKKLKENPLFSLKHQKKKKGKFFTKRKQKSILEKLNEAEKGIAKDNKQLNNVKIGGILNFKLIKNLFFKIKKKDSIISKKTNEAHSLIEFKDLIDDKSIDISLDTNNFFSKETKQIKKLLDQTNIKIYSPTSIGYMANFFVRKLTIYLIESYPNFFKNFYLILRKANFKLLSNTYVNIMLFVSLLLSLTMIFFTVLISIIQNNPIFLIFTKTFVMFILTFFVISGLFYYYPFMKVKERIKSINTNLPFAIDQMASVVSSGVAPATMFKLIAKTKEYGEVSIEIEKISNLIEIFGYDLLSSVRSVTTTTPSKILKEFFEGFISTVETGGSLKSYLSQKSKEALLSYQLERQKYIENISTYSDIYTGLLIAAPLFFVSTLSLVSLLGGKIGTMDVSTVMSLGTYLVIPLLNILFILFLEINQPEV